MRRITDFRRRFSSPFVARANVVRDDHPQVRGTTVTFCTYATLRIWRGALTSWLDQWLAMSGSSLQPDILLIALLPVL